MKVRALYDFTATRRPQLSFLVGEIFQVTRDYDENWYEVGSNGIIPKNHCQVLSVVDDNNSSLSPNTLMGLVIYDFSPEDEDELQVRKGDFVSIVATVDGWYLARYADDHSRLGLVPKSFVNIEYFNPCPPTYLPSVREWKQKQKQRHSGESGHGSPASISSPGSEYSEVPSLDNSCVLNSLLSASVPTYVKKTPTYFMFVVHVQRAGAKTHIIYRTYEEFYVMHQVMLLKFPKESGKVTGFKRIVPFIPGQVRDVTEEVTQKRRFDMDRYVKQLLQLPPNISKSSVVLDFFKPKLSDPPVSLNVDEAPQDIEDEDEEESQLLTNNERQEYRKRLSDQPKKIVQNVPIPSPRGASMLPPPRRSQNHLKLQIGVRLDSTELRSAPLIRK